MTTIRRRGGLFVAAATVSVVLLSTTTTTTTTATLSSGVLRVEANPLRADPFAVSSLRGGKREDNTRLRTITRRLEDEGEYNEEEGQEEGQEQQEQQQQQQGQGQEEEEQQQEEEEQQEEQQEEEQEGNDDVQNEYQYDDGYNNQNGDDDASSGQVDFTEMVENVKTTANDLMDRFDEDVVNMWSTSPSEWDDEFWKVFGIVGGIFTVLLSCILYICCLCCCNGGGDNYSGKEMLVATNSEAEEKRRERGRSRRSYHRGRRFLSMSRSRTDRTNETDTVGDDTSHTGRTTASEWESPFVLIEDVDGNDRSVSNHQPSSPVYATASKDAGGLDALSPLSSKTHSSLTAPKGSTPAQAVVESKTNETGVSVDLNTTITTIDDIENDNNDDNDDDDDDDNEDNGNDNDNDNNETTKTLKSTSSVLKEPAGGIINETVEVWSEFLGFKKSKYNIPPAVQTQDEDEDINLTDDEKTKRTAKIRASSNSPPTKKKWRSQSSGALSRQGHQMRAGTYTKPAESSSMSVSVAVPTVTVPSVATYNEATPIMSNVVANQARSTKLNSPRRTAYIKTKNLLRSFGNSKRGKPPLGATSTPSDPKEESLLSEASDPF